ncbi:MAG TPA: hypothetical protein VK864_01365 [Longimicrobiales bacterium]|nr:hypothetical protein [Longimicrobiales bacterium]
MGETWPIVLAPEDAPATEVTADQARDVVSAFRRAWSERLPDLGPIAQQLDPHMQSDRDFYVRRISGRTAAERVLGLPDPMRAQSTLAGDPTALRQFDWVWEVRFGGWSERLPPSGSFGGFITPDGDAALLVHWPEG